MTTTSTTTTTTATNAVNSTSSVTTTTTTSTASSNANTINNANLVDAYSFDDQSSNFQNASPPLFANSKSYKPLRNTINNNNSGGLSYSAKKYTNLNTSRTNNGCSDVNNNVNNSLKTIKKLKLENGNSTATSVAAQNSPSSNNNLESNVIIYFIFIYYGSF